MRLDSSDITGTSIVNDNPNFDCSSPAPTFTPLDALDSDLSSGNAVDCLIIEIPLFYTSSPGLAIPDNNSAGVSNTITIAHIDTIANMSIDLDIDHTWVADLIITLEHVETNTSVRLVHRPGCGTNDIKVRLIDGAGHSLQNDCQVGIDNDAYIQEEYEAENPLAGFSGKAIAGQWKLIVSDNATGDTGTLNSWTLRFNEWKSISAGGLHSCGIGTDNKAYCWGWGSFGQLGTGDENDSNIPKLVLAPIGGAITWKSISAGGTHSCGIGTDNKAYCWGSGGNGQLGTGDTNNSNIPKLVSAPTGVPSTWKSISAGGSHSCGLGTDNKAYCWGSGVYGQLGTGDETASNIPKLVLAPISGAITWKSISAGNNHSCGIAPDNKAYCWGSGSFGRLGTGNDTTVNKPTLVIDP